MFKYKLFEYRYTDSEKFPPELDHVTSSERIKHLHCESMVLVKVADSLLHVPMTPDPEPSWFGDVVSVLQQVYPMLMTEHPYDDYNKVFKHWSVLPQL